MDIKATQLDALPGTPEPGTMYFIRLSDGTAALHVTGQDGTPYRVVGPADGDTPPPTEVTRSGPVTNRLTLTGPADVGQRIRPSVNIPLTEIIIENASRYGRVAIALLALDSTYPSYGAAAVTDGNNLRTTMPAGAVLLANHDYDLHVGALGNGLDGTTYGGYLTSIQLSAGHTWTGLAVTGDVRHFSGTAQTVTGTPQAQIAAQYVTGDMSGTDRSGITFRAHEPATVTYDPETRTVTNGFGALDLALAGLSELPYTDIEEVSGSGMLYLGSFQSAEAAVVEALSLYIGSSGGTGTITIRDEGAARGDGSGQVVATGSAALGALGWAEFLLLAPLAVPMGTEHRFEVYFSRSGGSGAVNIGRNNTTQPNNGVVLTQYTRTHDRQFLTSYTATDLNHCYAMRIRSDISGFLRGTLPLSHVDLGAADAAPAHTLDVLGDSIAAGQWDLGASGGAAAAFTARLAGRLNWPWANHGVSGSTVAAGSAGISPMVNRTAALLSIPAGHILLAGGTNDFNSGVPLGTLLSTSTATFYGAVRATLTALLDGAPNSVLYAMTPIYRAPTNGAISEVGDTKNSAGHTLEQYRQAIRDVVALLQHDGYAERLVLLDVGRDLTPWFRASAATYMDAATGYHPNAAGQSLLADYWQTRLVNATANVVSRESYPLTQPQDDVTLGGTAAYTSTGLALDGGGRAFVEAPGTFDDDVFTCRIVARATGGAGTFRTLVDNREEGASSSTRRGWNMYAGSGDVWELWTASDPAGAEGGWLRRLGPTITLGQWVVLTVMVSATQTRLYVNGVEVIAEVTGYKPSNTQLRIGSIDAPSEVLGFIGDVAYMEYEPGVANPSGESGRYVALQELMAARGISLS
ncbi:GDSL-type esterase/lipase family protein [Deinococcus sp. HMF7604]|uniref:GDSL-type esterase/lipase family protein n=1 Tax=Deinococcus betulae TaxID=2873312 RepID=UPI001CCE187E|nr:GDSL-type esterase/lipase family protein [Deinococcus betulae]MBZ9750749.1 GDSL-type esterase/lipase family protein [Deinococcus betulae]